MGKRAREKACTNFRSEKIISSYEDYYRRVLEK
jgi:hypothetical protein